jgi:hypothetical protein
MSATICMNGGYSRALCACVLCSLRLQHVDGSRQQQQQRRTRGRSRPPAILCHGKWPHCVHCFRSAQGSITRPGARVGACSTRRVLFTNLQRKYLRQRCVLPIVACLRSALFDAVQQACGVRRSLDRSGGAGVTCSRRTSVRLTPGPITDAMADPVTEARAMAATAASAHALRCSSASAEALLFGTLTVAEAEGGAVNATGSVVLPMERRAGVWAQPGRQAQVAVRLTCADVLGECLGTSFCHATCTLINARGDNAKYKACALSHSTTTCMLC